MESGIISINNNIFETLLAISSDEQQKGLMYHKPPTPIMSFVYTKPENNRFWMLNTPAPLDIVFCLNNKISQIHYGEPYSTKMIGNHEELSDLIVELPHGTINSLNVKIGNSVNLLAPTTDEFKKIVARKLYRNY